MIPRRYLIRELRVIGSDWSVALSLDRQAVRALFDEADHDRLDRLHRCLPPDACFDVLASEDRLSLWLGDFLVSSIDARQKVEP